MKKKLAEFNTFIIQTLLPRLTSTSELFEFGSFYDRGLFYRQTNSYYKCISGPAQRALRPFLSDALKSEIRPLNDISDEVEKGINLERALVAEFASGRDISLECYQGGTPELNTKIYTNINFKVDQVYYFPSEIDIPPNEDNLTVLYLPVQRNYMGIDMIVHVGKTNTFYVFQVSVTAPWDKPEKIHQLRKAVDGYNDEKKKQYLYPLDTIIESVTYHSMNDPINPPKIVLLYGLGKSRENVISELGSNRKLEMYERIYFFDQQSMEKIQIVF